MSRANPAGLPLCSGKALGPCRCCFSAEMSGGSQIHGHRICSWCFELQPPLSPPQHPHCGQALLLSHLPCWDPSCPVTPLRCGLESSHTWRGWILGLTSGSLSLHPGCRLDYSGIALLIMGSFVPWLYYSFYCSPQPRLIYLSIVCVLGISAIIVAQWDRFATPKHRQTRAGRSSLLPQLLGGAWGRSHLGEALGTCRIHSPRAAQHCREQPPAFSCCAGDSSPEQSLRFRV